MKKLPILYILTNQNKKKFWEIYINEMDKDIYIITKYGIVDGKHIIHKRLIKPSKTKSALKIAETKLKSQWNKKKKIGYLENDPIRKNKFIKPMGSYRYEDYKKKIIYPAYIQPKLDGVRCISNKNKLYSKNNKEFLHLKHIEDELKRINKTNNIYLDGELYSHELKLHEITSITLKKYIKNENRTKEIYYYIFDMFDLSNMDITFKERYKILNKIIPKLNYIKIVPCNIVKSNDEIQINNLRYIENGYEGSIIRNMNGKYILNKKSFNVLSTKQFKKKIFEILDIEMKGTIIFKLKCGKNRYFYSGIIGKLNNKKYNNYKKYIGRKAIVKFIEVNTDGCVIRNPIIEKLL